MNRQVAAMLIRIREMEDSRFWKLRNAWFELKKRLGLSLHGALAPFKLEPCLGERLSEEATYAEWLAENAVRKSDVSRLQRMSAALASKPQINVVLCALDRGNPYLRDAIESVARQAYPYWKLYIVADNLTRRSVEGVIPKDCIGGEITVIVGNRRADTAEAINSAINAVDGGLLAFLGERDQLAPDALFEVALLLNERPNADIIYSDEDLIDDHGVLRAPCFKPDWSPDTLLSSMYIGGLCVYRTSLVRELGGLRPQYGEDAKFDLLLRSTERAANICHIPRVLYHRRALADESGVSREPNQRVHNGVILAIEDALKRRGEEGTVRPFPGSTKTFTIRYYIKKAEKVSVIIPTRDQSQALELCLRSIFERTTYKDFEVVVVDNGSAEAETKALFKHWETRQGGRFRVLALDEPFNYSRLNNYAVNQTDGRYLLFLNNDTEVVTRDWMEAMVEQAQRPSIGAVGAVLLYPDETIQHAGIILRVGDLAGHSHRGFPRGSPGYCGTLGTIRNYSAVTGACMMVRRLTFEEVGGFDECLAVVYNDVDLCLKLRAAGYWNVCLPHVLLYHREMLTRGQDNTPEKAARFKRERDLLDQRWQISGNVDPFYSPNLTRSAEDFSIGA